MLLEAVRLNGKEFLYRLARDAALTKSQYEKLASLPFAEVYFFRVANGRLSVRTRLRNELLALPATHKNWPRGSLDPAAVGRGSILSGREVANRRPFSARLQEGWIVYLFPARPGEDAVAFALAETQNSQAAWEGFLERFAASAQAAAARQALADIYLGQMRATLERFQAGLRDKTRGYSHLGEARQWFDRARALNLNTAAVAEAEAALAKAEAETTGRLRQARQLAEQADFIAAQQALDPILHFREEFPELAAELEAIRQLAAQHHLAQARTRLAQNQFDLAQQELATAAAYEPLDEIPPLREQIELQRAAYLRQQEIRADQARVQQAIARNDYATAFDLLAPLARRYPGEAKLQESFRTLQRLYRSALLAEAVKVEKLHAPIRGPADEEMLLKLHGRLASLAEFDASTELAVWRDRLGTYLADHYRQRARTLAPSTSPELSPLAFAFLQQAYHFALNKAELTQLSDWRERLEREQGIRVALNFRDLTPEAGGQYLLAELSAGVSAAIQKSSLPHVKILEAGRSDTLTPTLEFIVELLHASVRDEAEPETLKSEYSAGFRQVPNPAWRDAKATYDRSVESFEQVRAQVEQNRRKKKYSEQERRADDQALARAQAELKQAKEALDAQPAFIEQEDIRPYEFTRRTVTRTAQMRLSYRWVHTRTGVREVQQILEEREPARDVEVTGINAGDKHGHRNQPPNLPDAETMRGRVLRKVQERLAELAVSYLKAFIGRDFEQAQQKAARRESQAAAEDYLRFLYNSPADDPRRQQALEFLQREFRLVALGGWLVGPRESY
ncbi:MAG: hypothetical protein HY653_03655 [Acidobacteria bacterium]|nr:hypothetical protein [Acidobacteriota bacterium]